jgi:hypothetical protein
MRAETFQPTCSTEQFFICIRTERNIAERVAKKRRATNSIKSHSETAKVFILVASRYFLPCDNFKLNLDPAHSPLKSKFSERNSINCEAAGPSERATLIHLIIQH